ncbi:uncharacterized protein LOC8067038 isoform X1 [Sorghum bicolor]|uniref:uncharacterized protein LOC8067038 isoform X1 n=1 Tax=Sorghum bicolor TaxID=4558 RepID=UPI000B423CA0|nr:uncharacterized protein LOC8067038 isoform X1 [Sorghum bicolor]|eukprot:XP_021320112.1 uncharacterized protein LOC8067038 isoform X1 [Sorghum bicolor]
MPSSPWPPAAGAPPPQRATQGTVSTVALERGPVEGSRSPPAKEAEATAPLPSADYYSELKTLEHVEKTKKYQGNLAARLKAKYFSNKTFEKGYVFEEIVIGSKTIRLSGHLQGCLQIQQIFAKKRAQLRRTFLHLWLVKPCQMIKHLI